MIWAKTISFWRGSHARLGWLKTLRYHIIIQFHIWTFRISFRSAQPISPVLSSWTRWPCTDIVPLEGAPFSFRCQRCPRPGHRGTGNSSSTFFSQEILSVNWSTTACRKRKKASPSHSLVWPQIPIVKERSWAPWIAYSTRSKSKSNKGKVNCVEWIEFYWQQRSPPDCRWTSRTNIAHFWRKYKTNWTQTHSPPILCTVCR